MVARVRRILVVPLVTLSAIVAVLAILAVAGAAGQSPLKVVEDEVPWVNGGWAEYGQSGASGSGISGNNSPSEAPVALDDFVAWVDTHNGVKQIYARFFENGTWKPAGTTGASGRGVSNTSADSKAVTIAQRPNGDECLAWRDRSSGRWEVYLRCFDGTSGWYELGSGSAGGGGVTNAKGNSQNRPSLAFAADGTGYLAWDESDGNDYEIYVARWNGSSWSRLGPNNGAVSRNVGGSYTPSLGLDQSGLPYVAWSDSNSGNSEIYVARWNGTTWEPVGRGATEGGGISRNDGRSAGPSLAFDNNNRPLVAWFDDTSGVDQIYVRRWNGTSWAMHGAGSAASGGVSNTDRGSAHPSVAFSSDGVACVAWDDGSGGDREIYVRCFNGVYWAEVEAGSATGGGISDNSGDSNMPSLASGPGAGLVAAWSDNSGGDAEIYVRRTTAPFTIVRFPLHRQQLETVRSGHSATRLQNGDVLIAGGGTNKAEIYSPVTDAFFAVPDTLSTIRTAHSGTLLRDGRVLLAGGSAPGTAEIYNPITAQFTPVSGGKKTGGSIATLLPDGRVLFTGSPDFEVFDPQTNSFSLLGGDTSTCGGGETASLLPNGRVLITGDPAAGAQDCAEIYRLDTLTFQSTASLQNARAHHQALRLENGGVLVVGNSEGAVPAELFTPGTSSWSEIGCFDNVIDGFTLTLLDNGQVLASGGLRAAGAAPGEHVVLWDPQTNSCLQFNMHNARAQHTATLLADGDILITGGESCSYPQGSATCAPTPGKSVELGYRYVYLPPTPTATARPTDTPTVTPTATGTPTVTPTMTLTPTMTITPGLTVTATVTGTITATVTTTATMTVTPTVTGTVTTTPTPTATAAPIVPRLYVPVVYMGIER